jgi:uroporphyrinogen-III synthase
MAEQEQTKAHAHADAQTNERAQPQTNERAQPQTNERAQPQTNERAQPQARKRAQADAGKPKRPEPLRGTRILVPPSRLRINPLMTMLERKGAEVIRFPELVAGETDPAPLAEAARRLDRLHWVVFAGGEGVQRFFEQMEREGVGKERLPAQVGAIGHGALSALRDRSVEVTYRPREHYAEGVVAGMGEVRHQDVLLVRERHASEALPQALEREGARVQAVAGHEIRPVADRETVRQAWSRRLDWIAFANLATVRLFFEALGSLGLDPERCLAAVMVSVVGPATGKAAETHGLTPDLVAGGRLKRLLDALMQQAVREKALAKE